ncbi:MAG: hypothetical protein ACREXQ_10245 [Polaromonas sp.]
MILRVLARQARFLNRLRGQFRPGPDISPDQVGIRVMPIELGTLDQAQGSRHALAPQRYAVVKKPCG